MSGRGATPPPRAPDVLAVAVCDRSMLRVNANCLRKHVERMTMTSRTARTVAAATATTLLAGLLAATPQAATAAGTPVTITPNPAYASEPFEGWGTSLVWFANATGGYPEAVRQDLFDKVFGEDGLNLNIARYNIGGGNATDVPPLPAPGRRGRGLVGARPRSVRRRRPDHVELRRPRALRRGVGRRDDPAHYDFDADETQRWWIEALQGQDHEVGGVQQLAAVLPDRERLRLRRHQQRHHGAAARRRTWTPSRRTSSTWSSTSRTPTTSSSTRSTPSTSPTRTTGRRQIGANGWPTSAQPAGGRAHRPRARRTR